MIYPKNTEYMKHLPKTTGSHNLYFELSAVNWQHKEKIDTHNI